MNHTRRDWRFLLAALSVLAAGCREELGPEVWKTTRVTGTVREGRRPVGGGWIEFYPVDGTVGTFRVAPIGPDGSFAVEGVAVGMNTIGLAEAPIVGPYRHRFRSYQSPIRRRVPPGPAMTLDLDLVEEAAPRARDTPRDGDTR